MHGIELKSGNNDCYWDFEGRCIHQVTCRKRGMLTSGDCILDMVDANLYYE